MESDASKDRKEYLTSSEIDAAAAAAAIDRAEATERVEYANETAGGDGVPREPNRSQQFRSILKKVVQELGVGGWEAKVR